MPSRFRPVASWCGLGKSAQRQPVPKIPSHAWQLAGTISHAGDDARGRSAIRRREPRYSRMAPCSQSAAVCAYIKCIQRNLEAPLAGIRAELRRSGLPERDASNELRPYPPRRPRDRCVAEARRGNRCRILRRQSGPDWASTESGRRNRCSRPFRLYRRAGINRFTHARLLGRHIARHRPK